MNEIDAIKARINEAISILPGYSPCERCDKSAQITRRVFSDELDMKVCLACANEAERLGLTVMWIV